MIVTSLWRIQINQLELNQCMSTMMPLKSLTTFVCSIELYCDAAITFQTIIITPWKCIILFFSRSWIFMYNIMAPTMLKQETDLTLQNKVYITEIS
jgi:hypothetical protein